MKVFGELERAQIEQVTTLPTGAGAFLSRVVYLDTIDGSNTVGYYIHNGTDWKQFVDISTVQTLVNKTIDADLNTITNIENADIKSGAAIALNKLAATTVSRALVSDGSGVISPATTTATEIGYVNGVTSAIQTQLDAKVAKSVFTTKGDILVATGSATPVRQAIGSDNQVLVSDSSVTNGLKWTTLQQGAKNYITYNNFENNAITGWNEISATYSSNTPSGTPTISASAAANLALSVTSTNPLAGTYSLQAALTAPAVGVGFCSDSLTIDREDRAKVMQGSFYYEVASGTGNFSGTSSNTFSIWILDGASTWIQPAGVYSMNQSSGQGFCSFTFQTNSDTSTLRVVVFINAAATTVSVNFDDFYLGPQKVVYGAPVTDWQSYTPTVTNGGTTSTNTGKWRRVGDSIEIQTLQIFSGAGSAANLLIAPPTGITFDTTKTNGLNNVGAGSWFDASANQEQTGTSVAVSSTNIGVFIDDNGGTIVQGNQIASGDYIRLQIMLPIVGWSSTVQMSSDTDTRVVSARIGTSGAPTGTVASTFGSSTTIQFNSVTHDTHSAYVAATGYTVPVPGYYRVYAQQRITHASISVAQEVSLGVYKSGSLVQVNTLICSSTSVLNYYASVTDERFYNAGDIITIRAISGGTTPVTGSDSTGNCLVIERLSGPSAIAASEFVGVRVTSTDTTALATSSTATVVWNGETYDTHGAFASNTFTAPISGKYRVSGSIQFGAATYNSGSQAYICIRKNGSLWSYPNTFQWLGTATSASFNSGFTFSDVVTMNAGNTLDTQLTNTSGSNKAMSGSAVENFMVIERIGN